MCFRSTSCVNGDTGLVSWIIRAPEAAEAVSIGPMHLRAWHQTYPDVEHSVDHAWIDENIGHVDSADAAVFRSAVFADAQSMPGRVLYRVVENEGAVVGFCMRRLAPTTRSASRESIC
jgi:hypothetical protein